MEEKKLYKALTQMSPPMYRDFYKFYYSDRLKLFTVVSTVIGVILIAAAVMLYYVENAMVWIALCAWIGLFFLVYPHMAYRKPYKKQKDKKQTTHFSFYETYAEEKTGSEESQYEYKNLLKVVETPKYLFIYHSIDSVSIVVKDQVKGGYEGLCTLLKNNVAKYKKVK